MSAPTKNSTNPIVLKPGDSVIVDGVEVTFEEIIEDKIDLFFFRKHFKEQKGDA